MYLYITYLVALPFYIAHKSHYSRPKYDEADPDNAEEHPKLMVDMDDFTTAKRPSICVSTFRMNASDLEHCISVLLSC